jgi:serine/threonine protein kinase
MAAKPLKTPPKINDPLIGQQLGDYSIVSLLGRGGMARVYKGFDPKLERYSAVKVIDAHLAVGSEAPEYRERFHREARAIARLRHPNIVSVYQFGEYNNLYYMAMMFIEGRDLTYVLRDHSQQKTRMSYGAVLRIARDIGSALDYAHREGVIHRDIKPSNIMVMSDGHAILTDFGLALSVPEGSIGNTFGSAHYIAPEQAVASNNAVPQSDLYSLAVVLYQMLAGRVPFDDPSAMSVAIKHLQDPPPAPSLGNIELTAAVDSVLLKALHKQPEKRYPSGGALAIALEKALHTIGKPIVYNDDVTVENRATVTIELPAVHPEGLTPVLPPEDHATALLPPRPKSQANPPQGIKHLSESDKSRPPTAPYRPEIKPLTNPRPAVAPVWAQDLAGEMGSLPRLPSSKPRRRPWLFVAAAALSALVLWGIYTVSTSGTLAPPGATVDIAAQAATATEEGRPTREPTATPATAETPTEVSAVATTAPTPEVTAVSEGGQSASGSINLLLRYDGELLTMTNVGTRRLDLTRWEFAQRLADGSERIFRASQWGSSGFDVARFDPGECVQVWTDAFVSQGAPTQCVRQAWRSVSRPRWFWISSGSNESFVVREADDVLATCDIATGACEFAAE